MESGFLEQSELTLLRGLLGSRFFHLRVHDPEFLADDCVIRAAGVSIEQSKGVWVHLASDWWEDGERRDHFKLMVFQSPTVMHPSVARGATGRVVRAPQDDKRGISQVWFFNRGSLEEIEVYRGVPGCAAPGNVSDSLLVFRHRGQATFGLMPVFLPWGYFQISFSDTLLAEWKQSYALHATLRPGD